ncbi:hypothetical protein KKH24_00405, partial [Patescibacteria group bacterium]|nr:hypothetical protein [Patescibacteria group bacterium]
MKKPIKINLYNSEKKFRKGFFDFGKKSGIEINNIRLRYSIIHLKNGEKAKFVESNKEFSIDDAYNYIRLRGIEAQIPAIIAMYCNKKHISFNDPINSHHTRSVNKISQMMAMWLDKLPIPESIIVSKYSYNKNKEYILANINFPCVLKGYGDRGKSVWKMDSQKQLDKHMKLSFYIKKRMVKLGQIETFIIQEYISNTHDFRVTMFENEVLGVIKRISKDGFYNNFCMGADYEVAKITAKEKKLCQKACDACQIDLAGVDFVRTDDGILFFEVNKSPQINIKYPAVIAEKIAKKYL